MKHQMLASLKQCNYSCEYLRRHHDRSFALALRIEKVLDLSNLDVESYDVYSNLSSHLTDMGNVPFIWR